MPELPDLPQTEAAIIELTSQFRAQNGLQRLAADPTLAKAARGYARFLAASSIFSHEADGRRPGDRIEAAGYGACQHAENLAWMLDSRGFQTRQLAQRMVEGWKNSPGHRKNMLLEHVTEIGVALSKVTGQHKYIAVQLFGRPKRLSYRFEVVNRSRQSVTYTFGGKPVAAKPGIIVRHTACIPSQIRFDAVAGNKVFSPQPGHRFTVSDQGRSLRVEATGQAGTPSR